jgi:hypothetical protein
MSTEINEYIFTLRGHPVLFKRSMFCGALYATERGSCPFSPTGFYSLAAFTRLPINEPDNRHPAEIVSQDFLESLAVENDRQRKTALHNARQTAQKCSRNRRHPHCHTSISMDADDAMLYGFFATEEQRTELWQMAFCLYLN